jgi:hypothetical protein
MTYIYIGHRKYMVTRYIELILNIYIYRQNALKRVTRVKYLWERHLGPEFPVTTLVTAVTRPEKAGLGFPVTI